MVMVAGSGDKRGAGACSRRASKNTLSPTHTHACTRTYSMDYNEAFRDMGHICVISEDGIKEYAEEGGDEV